MSAIAATDIPIASADSGKGPSMPITGPVLIGDILNARGDRPDLLRLWEDWERQIKNEQ